MLLLSVLLDTELPVRQGSEFFLELHNNASIQATTAEYLGRLSISELLCTAAVHTCAALLLQRHPCAHDIAACLAFGLKRHAVCG